MCLKKAGKKNYSEVPAAAALNEEISSVNASIFSIQKELKSLKDATDHAIGGLSYLASEYDDFIKSNCSLSKSNQSLVKDLRNIKEKQIETEKQLDNLEQYGRRENLEIHGIPVMRNENTNQIIKSVAKSLNIALNDSEISTSHRLIQPDTASSNRVTERQQTRTPTTSFRQHPPAPIIVRFSNRDKRNELYRQRKNLQNNTEVKSIFGSASNISIKENLTAYRKMLYGTAKLAQRDLNFKFLWTSQGRIRLRQNETSRIISVTSLADLKKIGYAGPTTGAVSY